jgi:putative membrane protein
MLYTIIKALHIIFMVSYFAGIFYLVRIFVYYKDTDEFAEEKKKSSENNIHLWPKALEYHHRSCRSNYDGLRTDDDFSESRTDENAMVSFKTYLPDRFGGYHYWCWKKVLKLKELNGNTLKPPI